VKSILGDPSIVTQSKLVYYFGYRRKTPPQTVAQLRNSHPDMSDADVEYADGEAFVEARFASGKLNYLAISKSETY
jgi:hypothetical protein